MIDPTFIPSTKRPRRLPTVLTKDEVCRLFVHLSGVHLLMARLLYTPACASWNASACGACGWASPGGAPSGAGQRPAEGSLGAI